MTVICLAEALFLLALICPIQSEDSYEFELVRVPYLDLADKLLFLRACKLSGVLTSLVGEVKIQMDVIGGDGSRVTAWRSWKLLKEPSSDDVRNQQQQQQEQQITGKMCEYTCLPATFYSFEMDGITITVQAISINAMKVDVICSLYHWEDVHWVSKTNTTIVEAEFDGILGISIHAHIFYSYFP